MNRTVFRYFVIAVLVLVSCKQNDPIPESYSLDGEWQIYEAYRNNELTTTLQDGYFKFADTTMETNILGTPISGMYRLDEQSFIHKSSLPATYTITQYSTDTMQLATEIKGFRFKFKLNRFNDTIPSN